MTAHTITFRFAKGAVKFIYRKTGYEVLTRYHEFWFNSTSCPGYDDALFYLNMSEELKHKD